MSNLFDYLTWRNDLTFSKVPCCAVDTLICSCLSYLRLQPVFAKQDMLYVNKSGGNSLPRKGRPAAAT